MVKFDICYYIIAWVCAMNEGFYYPYKVIIINILLLLLFVIDYFIIIF